jgi:hypothetical protein
MLTKKEIIIPQNPPQLIIIVGPCRTGTTALANIFAKIGITVYMQPIRSARRAEEMGNKIIPWNINVEDIAVTKETIGVDTPVGFFDPLQILLDFGYPKKKIQLIPIIRDQRKTLASWKQMWGDINRKNFIKSYELTQKIKNKAEHIGIETIPYVHEIIRDQNSDIVIQNLFNKLSLFNKLNLQPDVSRSVVNWQNDVKFGEENTKTSKLKFYDVPAERFIKEIKERRGYQYREKSYLYLSPSDIKFLENNKKLKAIYEEFRQGCQNTLGLKIKPYDAVDY